MASALYTPGPTQAQLDAAGLTIEDFAGDAVEIWPENVVAYNLFASLQTQWRGAGMGLIGLDYNTLFHKLDRMGLDPDDYEHLENDIRTMEYAAIEAMRPPGE